MKYKLFFLLVITLLNTNSFGQKVINEMPVLDWRPEPVMSDYCASYHAEGEGFSQGIIYTSESEGIVTMRYPNKKFGIACIDNKGKVKWETKVDGLILRTAKMKDRIIVLYTKDIPNLTYSDLPIKTLEAATVDLRTGAVVSTNEVFKSQSRYYKDVTLHVSNNEQDCYLLVRYSTYKVNIIKTGDKYVSTAFELYTIKKDLQVSEPRTIASKFINNYFLAAAKLPDGNLVLISHSATEVIVEKINPTDATIVDQLSVATNFENVWFMHPLLQADKGHVYLSLSYVHEKDHRTMGLYDIDWESRTIKVQSILNKEFIKSLSEQLGEEAVILKKHY